MQKKSAFDRIRKALRRIFFWLPSNTNEEIIADHVHDHALIAKVVTKNRPSRYRQLRHAGRVLNINERRLILGASSIAIIALLFAAGTFVWQHSTWAPAVGGTYTEALIGQPKYLNPIDAIANDIDRDIVRLVYSGLFRFDELEAVPDLAESYRWSADAKSLTIVLRADARFHDGQPLTSEDVQFTFDSILDPARKSPLAPLYRGMTLETPDEHTVIFHLDKPDAIFLTKLTVGILPVRLWQNVSTANARLSELNVKPIGSGPYRIKSFLRDSSGNVHSYTLERAEMYYGLKPFTKTIVFQFFPDRLQALEAFRSELIDGVAFAGAAETGKLLSSTRKQGIHLELPEETVAFFNVKDKLLAQPAVRKALIRAVNRDDIVSTLGGYASPVYGPFPFGSATSAEANLAEARKILDEANWIIPTNGNIRVLVPTVKPKAVVAPSKTTSKITPVAPAAATSTIATTSSTELALTIAVPDQSDLQAIAQVLQRQWSLLGVKVDIVSLPTEELMKKTTREKAAQVVLLNILLTPTQDLFPFWWSGQSIERGVNFSNLADRGVDDALEKARNATNTADLQIARTTLARNIIGTDAAVFLVRPQHVYLLSQSLKGIEMTLRMATPAERFQDIEHWYVKSGWHWK